MSKLLIHLGPHKTATTSLQNLLVTNEKQLNAAGIGLISTGSSVGKKYKEVRAAYTRVIQALLLSGSVASDKDIENISNALLDVISVAGSDYDTLVLSDENLIGPPPGHTFAAQTGIETGFYGAALPVFKAIKKVCEGKEYSVLLCKRDLNELLNSSFNDLKRKPKSSVSREQYFNRISESIAREYDEFFNSATKLFDGNLCEVEFDYLCADVGSVIERFIDVPIDCIDTEMPHLNRSIST